MYLHLSGTPEYEVVAPECHLFVCLSICLSTYVLRMCASLNA
jgi:hypothetical protein